MKTGFASIACLFLLSSAVSAGTAIGAPVGQPFRASMLERLAMQQFGILTEAETRLLRAVPTGKTAWCGPSESATDPANDPARAADWGAQRVIRAALLRWLAADPQASKYIYPSGVEAAGAKVQGKFDLSFLSVAVPLNLRQCWLPDGINISSTQLRTLALPGSRTGAIDARGAIIHGDLVLNDGAYGPVDLSRAQIDGDLICTGARMNSGKVVFSGLQAAIGGDASFNEGFETNGEIDLSLIRIGGNLSFYDARFSAGGSSGLSALSATVAGAFYWVGVKLSDDTQLDLTQAKVGALWDDKQSWPRQGKLLLDGFIYSSIVGPLDSNSRLDWLNRQPKSYWPQPYRQLAKVLEEGGEPADAAEVMIAREDALREFGGLGFGERAWRLILRSTIGYGYKPLRALWWMISFVIVGTVLFEWGYRAGAIIPADEKARRSLSQAGELPPGYQPFDSRIFSLEHFLPLVELFQKEYWLPNPRSGSRRRLPMLGWEFDLGALIRWYLLVHILAGWILTPLFLAGLSGLVRAG